MESHIPLHLARLVSAAVLGGLLGGAAMLAVMRLITRANWARFDMVAAVGSLVTRSRANARPAGLLLHAASAVVFGLLYAAGLWGFNVAELPASLYAGILIGIVHGTVISLTLVWIVAEQHPLEEFREAGIAVGLVHFAGHVAYGAVVGLVIGLSAT
ncbi:MAG TPA: hypothetical protein VGG34_13515 [Opitutaceae bacterium]|jgi:hypothetical protein